MRVSRDAWVLIGLFVVMVMLFAIFARPMAQTSDLSTSFSAAPNGVKAFYTLLGERLGYTVDRLESPYTELPDETSMLIVVGPVTSSPIAPAERVALEKWVRSGGTVVFISDSLKNVPARFGSTRRLGRGFVYAMNSRRIITNRGVHDYRNAMKVLDVVARHAPRSGGGLVLFDEYHHGLGRSKAQAILVHTQPQMKLGFVVIAVAVLVLCYGRGRRFGAVRGLPASESLRPEFEFVESVARLYERAGAADAAADILVRSLRQSLCLKLGMSSDAPSDMIARQLESEGHEQAASRVRWLLAHEQAGQKLSKSELVHVAREINALEKELGLGRIVA